MWFLANLAGFGVQPEVCGRAPTTIGPTTPNDTVWRYHEDYDLFEFEPTQEGNENYTHVAVYRFSYPGVEDIYEEAEVKSPFISKTKNVLEAPVGPSVTRDQARNMAQAEASKQSRNSVTIQVAVKYDPRVRARDQMLILRPRIGFEGRYMITLIEPDLPAGGYYLNRIEAVWL